MIITLLSFCLVFGAGLSIGYLLTTRNKPEVTINPDVKDVLREHLDEDDDIVRIHKKLVTKSSSDYENNRWVIEGKLYYEE